MYRLDNLSSKVTHFVYELVQNAEDNSYSIAKNASESPWLYFSMSQDRIVIDSNEDGFSNADLEALCSVGKSTKKNFEGFIGEKGIGFKSVFKVANRVHVQSEPYSFAFEYQHDANHDALGIITPIIEQYFDMPPGVRTRFTLHILPSYDRTELRQEFLDLPDTLLLFLKKLKVLRIKTAVAGHPDVEHEFSISTYGNRACIHKAFATSRSHTTKNYWVTRWQVANMPDESKRKNVSKAEVVLAFPLDADDIPIIENQHVFAFLPLRKVGYKVSRHKKKTKENTRN